MNIIKEQTNWTRISKEKAAALDASKYEIKKEGEKYSYRLKTNTATTTPSWDNYPCVVELANSNNSQKTVNNEYRIGDFTYYPNGVKFNRKTKEKGKFTCNDAEFKKSNTGGSSNTGGGKITKGWVKDPTGNTTWEYQVRNCNWIAKKIGDKTEYNISKNAKFAGSVKKLNKAYPSLISNCVGKQGNEKSAEYGKKFGQELERAKSLMDKKIEYTASDYRKFLTNPATNTADSTATSAKSTVDIKPVESEISGPVNTINPADQNF